CNRSNAIVCPTTPCPTTGHCSDTPATICTATNDCHGPGNTCVEISPEVCVRTGVTNTGGCSTTNDDMDVDKIRDSIDDCPTVYNAAVILNTNRQLDTDSDGLGTPATRWDRGTTTTPARRT